MLQVKGITEFMKPFFLFSFWRKSKIRTPGTERKKKIFQNYFYLINFLRLDTISIILRAQRAALQHSTSEKLID
jgi:hypothetical protein